MNKNLTEIVFILDRSGSMHGLEGDTIGGFNSLLEKQKAEEGEAVVTTVLFDDKYELLHDRINIKGISPITTEDYYVRGCTALLDAIGNTISKIDNTQKHTLKDQSAENVMFVIVTDGLENASKEFTHKSIKEMVESKKKSGWEFIFLGANIDAIAEGAKIGIEETRACLYHANSKGVRNCFASSNDAISMVRDKKVLDENWKKENKEK